MNPLMLGYRNPYPSHYDSIPFSKGYQKSNFEKFNRINRSTYEHLAHFYLACGETALNDTLLIRQFIQSLKGATFTWYTLLQPGSLHTWDDLQRAVLAQFVSLKHKVFIIDLADTSQGAKWEYEWFYYEVEESRLAITTTAKRVINSSTVC